MSGCGCSFSPAEEIKEEVKKQKNVDLELEQVIVKW